MATIADLMLGIEGRLQTIDGLRTSEYVADAINPPHAIVGVPPVDYMTGLAVPGTRLTLDFTVTVLVSANLDRVGQLKLAEYAAGTGPSSVVAAVEADKSLGGVAESCQVLSFEPLGLEQVGAIGYYGGEFVLRTIARS